MTDKEIELCIEQAEWLTDMYKHLAKGGEIELYDNFEKKYNPTCIDLGMYSDRAYFRKAPLLNKITIREIRYPEAETVEPKFGDVYFTPALDGLRMFYNYTWDGQPLSKKRLSRGLIHLNEEAAAEHTAALLGDNRKEAE